jgi:hypothetical protein
VRDDCSPSPAPALPCDEIARIWLEYALAAHRRGEIVYPTPAVAANGKLTLFPEDSD